MVWTRAATVILDSNGRYQDADATALELLGVPTVDVLRATPPETFAALPVDPAEQEAWRATYRSSRAVGVLAETAVRRTDGELVRVKTAIMERPDGSFRALFYPVERPTTNLTAKVYRIGDILSEWRAAERRLVDLDPASDEGQRIAAEVALLREQYQRMFDAVARKRTG